jgi:hypothetical protein
MKPLPASAIQLAGLPEPLIINLTGGFAATAIDWKAIDRGDAVTCRAQGLERFSEAEPERTNSPGGDDSDPSDFYDLGAKCHSVGNLPSLSIPVDL